VWLPVLVVETAVNDALPPRFSGTHKCVEGLVRAAHAAHAAYRAHPDDELSVVRATPAQRNLNNCSHNSRDDSHTLLAD
jgi:hypothetical protein